MAPSSRALGEIAQTLHENIAQVAHREATWAECANAAARAPKHAAWLQEEQGKRQELGTRAQAMAQRTSVTDQDLSDCETELRDLAAHLETLRQKLAAWAARAIG